MNKDNLTAYEVVKEENLTEDRCQSYADRE